MKPPEKTAAAPVIEDRTTGKHILTLMTYLPVEDIRSVWAGMTKEHRLRLFGHGHAEELDNFIRHLGKKDVSHLQTGDNDFGRRLAALHSGDGMDDHRAARVLHTASGVRMAHLAVEGPGKVKGGQQGHEERMRILNARYREKD